MSDKTKKETQEKSAKKEVKVKTPKVKQPLPTWEKISDRVYNRIESYATRFIIISVIGVVVGFIGIIYSVLNIFFLGSAIQDISVAIGVFIGLGAIVASLILLLWGFFWRRKVEGKTIF